MERVRSFFKVFIFSLFLSTSTAYSSGWLDILAYLYPSLKTLLNKQIAPLLHKKAQDMGTLTVINQNVKEALTHFKNMESFHYQCMTGGIQKKGPQCVLLYGEPGTGKTHTARGLAGKLHTYYLEKSGSSFLTKWQGSGTESVNTLFKEARSLINQDQPGIQVVICIDEIDRILKKREDAGLNDSGRTDATTELLTELTNPANKNILIVGTTNLLNELDPASLRTGRLGDWTIHVDKPNEEERTQLLNHFILKALDAIEKRTGIDSSTVFESNATMLNTLRQETDGFVVSDIELTVERAFNALTQQERAQEHVIEKRYRISSEKIRTLLTFISFCGGSAYLWNATGTPFMRWCQNNGIDRYLRVLGGEVMSEKLLKGIIQRNGYTKQTKTIYFALRLIIMFIGWKLIWPMIKKALNTAKTIVPEDLNTLPTQEMFMNAINTIKEQKRREHTGQQEEEEEEEEEEEREEQEDEREMNNVQDRNFLIVRTTQFDDGSTLTEL